MMSRFIIVLVAVAYPKGKRRGWTALDGNQGGAVKMVVITAKMV